MCLAQSLTSRQGIVSGFFISFEGYFVDNYYLNMAIWCFGRIALELLLDPTDDG